MESRAAALPDRPLLGSAPLARIATLVAVAVAGLTLALSWLRRFYGIDFTDESFYIALPLRFALGDMPLRDEQNLAQFAGYLALPFYRLFLWLSGGTDGIMLFARHLHLLYTVAVAAVVFLAVRGALHWRAALLTATICLVFVPFNLHGISYNTLGSGFLTIGCFLLLHRAAAGSARWHTLAAGLCHGLMVLVYPTLLPIALLFLWLLATQRPGQGAREAGTYLAGGLLAALVPAWLVLQAGWDSVLAIRGYLAGFHNQLGGLDKVFAIVRGFLEQTPHLGWVVAALAVLWAWHRFHPPALRYVLPLLPAVLAFYWIGPNGTASLYLVAVVALAGPFVYPFLAGDAFARHLMRLVWIPSFIAGLVTAWSSSNGMQNACIGMFPAALASVLTMQMAVGRWPASESGRAGWKPVLQVVLPLLVIVPLLRGGYADYYGEPVQRDRLTHRVQGGPFHGLLTTAQRHAFLERFAREAKPLIRPDDRVLVFNEWPGGYLLAGVRPAANSIWLPSAPLWVQVDRAATFDYWARTDNRPTVVLLVKASSTKADALLFHVLAPSFADVADIGSVTLRRRTATP